MAKEFYKIRDSLDKNMFDMEITIKGDSGLGLRPLPVKIVLGWIASILLCFAMVSKTFLSAGGPVVVVIFVLTWLALTFTLFSRDKTNIPQYSLVLSMLNYLPKNMRRVLCRKTSDPTALYNLIGIDGIDEGNGKITFIDGTVGNMYAVVGTGSVLLFEQDRDAILDRVDAFYKKMKTEYQLIFITVKAAQNVDRQVKQKNADVALAETIDPELAALAAYERDVLTNHVGKQFRSIHQYMILKADNDEALVTGRNMLLSECENSQLMFKRCRAIFKDEILNVFKQVYKGQN